MGTIKMNLSEQISNIKRDILDGNEFDRDDKKFMEGIVRSAAWRANPKGVSVEIDYTTGDVVIEMDADETKEYVFDQVCEGINNVFYK